MTPQSEGNLKRNPWGKVPSVTFPDGFTVYESRAICKFLTRELNFPLMPPASDLRAAATFDQAESEEMIYFAEPTNKISFEKFVKNFLGLPTNEAVVSEAHKSLEAFFDLTEKALSERNYMAGPNFSLVDISYIPLINRLFACGFGDLVSSRKAVNAWWERCTSRPAIQQVLAADKAAAAGR